MIMYSLSRGCRYINKVNLTGVVKFSPTKISRSPFKTVRSRNLFLLPTKTSDYCNPFFFQKPNSENVIGRNHPPPTGTFSA
jgi:hypothetical protein